ncbi:DUF4054 domain-containing protein [Achromobacter xylosoxidans]
MDLAAFRADFPEFADTTRYTDSQLTLWSTMAEAMLNQSRWGTLWPLGVKLYTAHHLAIAARNQQSSTAGGIPGQVTGPQSSKSVDKVSVSYDTGSVANPDATFWNLTTYGIELWRLIQMFGAGGVQL